MENVGSIRKSFFYRKLSSTKTTIFLLFLLSLLYLIGTVFPQEVEVKEYVDAGGRFVFAAQHLGLLHIFRTPLFFLTGALLSLNALFCTLERVRSLLNKTSSRDVKNMDEEGETLTQSMGKEMEETLKSRGYRLKNRKSHRGGLSLTFKKGFDLSLLSILYHGGIFIAILAFFHTHYYAFENTLTLFPGKSVEVSVQGGEKAPFSLKLNRFRTLYVDNPEFHFPEKGLQRISAILSPSGVKGSFSMGKKRVAVSDWLSDLSVMEKGREVLKKEIQVNDPLRYRGFTFYQMGYMQEITIESGGKVMTVESGRPFSLRKGGEKFILSSLRHGEVRTVEGKIRSLPPGLSLYRAGKTAEGRWKKEGKGLDIKRGERKLIGGRGVTFQSFREASILSYRIDPAASLLSTISYPIVLFILLCLTLSRKTIRVRIDGKGEAELSCVTKGAFSSKEKEKREIVEFCRKKGITLR